MAHKLEKGIPPGVIIPQALSLFMVGFTAETESQAKVLFELAVKSICKSSNLTQKDLHAAYSLFRKLNPQDDFERIWCAQFIVGHLLGTHNLSLPSPRNKRIGLKLLQAANDAMERINKKRQGITDDSHIIKE